MTKKQRAQRAVDLLKEKYPLAECSLEYRHPYELLISTRLSAQCTDARVNIVTKELFGKYDSLEKLANAEYEDILAIVKPLRVGQHQSQRRHRYCQRAAGTVRRPGALHHGGADQPAGSGAENLPI